MRGVLRDSSNSTREFPDNDFPELRLGKGGDLEREVLSIVREPPDTLNSQPSEPTDPDP